MYFIVSASKISSIAFGSSGIGLQLSPEMDEIYKGKMYFTSCLLNCISNLCMHLFTYVCVYYKCSKSD